jgi:uncharacterized protein (DUF1697 family)
VVRPNLENDGLAQAPYVALLRGINVGGRNIVSMADLRAVFEAGGYGRVRTHIQSGNVVFTTDAPPERLEDDLESLLERDIGRALMVVARSRPQVREVVAQAPDGFGADPDAHKYDAMFLKAPLTPAQVMDVLDLREGVDRAWPGPGVVYFSRDADRLSTSRMSRITGKPAYQRMTIRNWRTTTTLLAMLEDA